MAREQVRTFLEDVYLGDLGTRIAQAVQSLAERGIVVSADFLKEVRRSKETGNDTAYLIRTQKLVAPGNPVLRSIRKDALYLRIAEEGQGLQMSQIDNPYICYSKGYTEALAQRLGLSTPAVRGARMNMRAELVMSNDPNIDALLVEKADKYVNCSGK